MSDVEIVVKFAADTQFEIWAIRLIAEANNIDIGMIVRNENGVVLAFGEWNDDGEPGTTSWTFWVQNENQFEEACTALGW